MAFGGAREIFLVISGEEFDAKVIVGAAHGFQFSNEGPLNAIKFTSGGAAVQQVLERMGFTVRVTGAKVVDPPICYPDDVEETSLPDGASRTVTVNAYERNPELRRRCLAALGTVCCICRFDFGAVYGSEFVGFIHVHHLRPLSEVGGVHHVDPVNDLRPVCPNCHAVIHSGPRCRTIEEVRELIANASRFQRRTP